MDADEAKKLTEEMVADVELDEKTLKTVRFSRYGVEFVAMYGISKLIDILTRAVCMEEPNKLKTWVVKFGSGVLNLAIDRMVDNMFEEVESFTNSTIKAVKAYKKMKKSLEENDGSDTESESEE